MRHSYKHILFIQLSIFFIILSGCSSAEWKKAIEPKPKEMSAGSTKNLDAVVLMNAKEQKISPPLASTKQYKFVFKDKSHYFLPKTSILNEATLDRKSIVILDSQKIDRNLVVLDYQYEKEACQMKQILTLDTFEGEKFKEKGDINIPFDEYTMSSLADEEQRIWAFTDKKKLIVVSVYSERLLDDTETIDSVDVKDKTLYISNRNKKSYI